MKKNDLGKQNIFKLCLAMGIPCIAAQLVNLLYSIVDRIYIGNMPQIGSDALGGLGLAMPIITIVSAFSSFVSGGGAPLAAKALGEGKVDKARSYLCNGFLLLIFFSIVLTAVFYGISSNVLDAIGSSNVTKPYALEYLYLYLGGTIFVQLSIGLNTFITAQGKSKTSMISVLIGAIINIILDPLFIFVFDMGIKGAALATIISQAISAIWILTVLFNKKNVLHIDLKRIKISLPAIGAILSLGVAPFVMAATESVIGFVLNKELYRYGGNLGDTYVSLLTILQSSMLLITVPLTGFTQGVTPIISYNFGAGNKRRVVQTFKIVLTVCFSYCTFLALLMIFLPGIFTSMYTSREQDMVLYDLSVKIMPIFMLGMLIFGIQRACQTTFVALGESVISLLIAILRKIIFLVPLAMILPKFVGVEGVFWAEPIADSMAATLCGIIFLIRFRIILRKMPDEIAE